MSYIGKILVVMQLVLSICLMAFAAAVSSYQTNWKAKAEATQAQLSKAQQDNNDLTQQMQASAAKHDADMKQEKATSGELTSKVAILNAQVTNLSAEAKRRGEELNQKTQISSDLADDSVARQNEVRLVRVNLMNAYRDRDKENTLNAALQDKNFEMQTKLDRLVAQNTQLMKDNQNYRDVLAAKGLPTEIEEYQRVQAPPPKVEGKVLETRKPSKGGDPLLTISLGENDGLVKGNVLLVYRRGTTPKFLGKARVLYVSADQAVCTLFQRSGLVEKGDDVTTQLN